VIVDKALYRAGCRQWCGDLSDELATLQASAPAGDFLWVGLKDPTIEEFAEVNEELGLHPLAIEDAVRGRQRVKLEHYADGVVVLVLRPLRYIEATSDIESGELMVIVGSHFLLTVRRGEAAPLAGVRQRLEQDEELLARGPQAALHAVLDKIVDDYVAIDEEVAADLEEIESDVFSDGDVDTGAVYRLKREILEFKRAVVPLSVPIHGLYGSPQSPVKDEELQLLFRDVADHAQQVIDHIDAYDRLLADILTAHLAAVGVRQNSDMRKISAWVAIAALPTMLAGIYGMNFEFMPELSASFDIGGQEVKYGYFVVLAVMVASCVALYRGFRRSGWL
jgi:magnesium transporter